MFMKSVFVSAGTFSSQDEELPFWAPELHQTLRSNARSAFGILLDVFGPSSKKGKGRAFYFRN
jgi:hypothetical protein